MKRLITFIASGLGTGYFPIVPGTVGTIPAWLLAWFFFHNFYLLLGVALATTVISIGTAGLAEPWLGHDSRKIVIDEWAGMFVSLLFLPYRLDVYIAAFVFFRFYDVVKPYPANACEAWPGGWGITFDDIFAAVYANLTCWLCIIVLHHLAWFGF